MPTRALPKSEVAFRGRYTKSPSFLSMHMGVHADLLPKVPPPPPPARGAYASMAVFPAAGTVAEGT